MIKNIVFKLNKLIELNSNSSLDTDIQTEINSLVDVDNKKKFNMSHLESLTEKPLVKNQISVKRILPLISLQGILYITTRNIYFQTLHSVASKPVKVIHIDEIITLFKRRYELQHVIIYKFISYCICYRLA